MEEWLSVTQLSKTLGIPETTTRRYLNNFEEYFRWEQIGRGKKYHPGSVDILQKIATLYGADRETAEIKVILADEYAFSIEDSEQSEPTTYPPTYNVAGKLDEFQQKQEDFNIKLLKQLHEQQRYIQELAETRNIEIQEAKRLVSPEEKRIERLEQIMTEHKVKSLLKKEALSLWNDKPVEERMRKIGLFRKEEDRDKRDMFIQDYIDEHFEMYLKREFGVVEFSKVSEEGSDYK